MKASFGASPNSGAGRVDDKILSFTSTFIFNGLTFVLTVSTFDVLFDVAFATFNVWLSTV